MPTPKSNTVILENVNHPGQKTKGDAAKYQAMRKVFLKIVPKKSPGLSAAELYERVVPLLPEKEFPGGATAGWWLKAVQLDLEAKGLLVREKTSPLRWHKA
jgi:hypothetical protein